MLSARVRSTTLSAVFLKPSAQALEWQDLDTDAAGNPLPEGLQSGIRNLWTPRMLKMTLKLCVLIRQQPVAPHLASSAVRCILCPGQL